MNQAVIHFHPSGPLLALVGNPNCGKTALFNLLTGSRQKVANYAGVTVERKEGRLTTPSGRTLRILDLPGAYSLYPRSPDERVTCDVLFGRAAGEKRPDLVVCVVDATNLRRNLRLALAVKRLGLPCVVALNMADLAEKRGIRVVAEDLAIELGLPVVSTIAIQSAGAEPLLAMFDDPVLWQSVTRENDASHGVGADEVKATHESDHLAVRHILQRLGLDEVIPHTPSDRIDSIVLHPAIGPVLLALVLFLVFQAVFAWAELPMALIKEATQLVGAAVSAIMPEIWLKSLIVDGVIAGAGGVLVFLPQIVILYFFILVLEESGYLPRAAFLLDRLMGSVGLSGRSFIPMLSSFACAIPGIMAARSIANPRDRLVTIMLAPLMTCSARLPVYALLIGAFIPQREVWGLLELQGLVLLALYFAGVVGALLVAWMLKRFTAAGRQVRPLMMELPSYHLPTVRNIAIGIWQRVLIFLKRVGGIILVLTIALWLLASFPSPPDGASGAAIEYSLAGMLGRALAVVFEPIGFNWEISIALVPGLAAREVAVSALGTVYALSATGEDTAQALAPLIAQSWSLATALSLLAWYVFAPQCLSTLATVKRETGGWAKPAILAGYMFTLAYIASFITYRLALAFGAG
ncbi:MAG: ferrous iron transporter B [Propionivibrio sp.]|uniref:ferrous iron transporter B n=1 Tax=Propionivibrio sp. TaxID=2212460 RepID=UPI0025FB5CF0|nr:ferrous iron transporter B [Propionivibrio sp.]MBK8401814.1 ferrous iron transporter B [Propionivibrio sp.]MBL0208280.1 ferrous iron transporter B [Propionivibrio sp.]